MRSSFTAMALAFAIVTMTGLPVMALTLDATPAEGGEVVTTPSEQLDSQMGLVPNTLQVGPEMNTQGVFPSENRPQAGIAGPALTIPGVGPHDQTPSTALTIPGIGPHDQTLSTDPTRLPGLAGPGSRTTVGP